MKLQENKSGFSITRSAVLPLSRVALTEPLQAVLVKGRLFRSQLHGFSMSPSMKGGVVVTVPALLDTEPYLGYLLAFIYP